MKLSQRYKFLKDLQYGLERARKKHPHFAKDRVDAAHVISCELTELYEAVAYETWERQKAKALDVAATAIRFYLGEFDHPQDIKLSTHNEEANG